MKTYDEIKELIAQLRNNKVTLGHGEYGVDPLCEQAADVVELLFDIVTAADAMRTGIREAGVKREPLLYWHVMVYDGFRSKLEKLDEKV